MGLVAANFRYRKNPATVKTPAAQGISGGSGGSPVFEVGEKRVESAKHPPVSRNAESIIEAFEERAAILEHDGGMNREEAEALARRLTGYEGA